MSRFISSNYADLVPYIPGEQPRDPEKLIKLNTNECPYPPSEKARAYASAAAESLQRYCSTDCRPLREKLAALYELDPDEIMCTNGSDEALDLCFQAFCDETHPAAFADITYGFYSVFCQADRVPCHVIPLKEDMTLCIEDYIGLKETIFIANPNAPTGISIPRAAIERILQSNPDNIVVIDEAYIDFGGESSICLIHQYENLIVTQTCSKSRSLAGARLGFAFANKALIADLNALRNSRNPYNVNSMTMAAGLGALQDEAYTRLNCEKIKQTRAYLTAGLKGMGFTVLNSDANFVFAKSEKIGGQELYLKLKEKSIFIRHFETERLRDYNRITVGTTEQTDILLCAIQKILEEKRA